MKNLLLSLLAFICYLTASSQNKTLRYHFDYGLNEVFSQGPVLKSACQGMLSPETLPAGGSQNVYHFDKGCGLVFYDSAGFLASGSYTIEVYVMLDTISGYKKLVDMDSLGKDKGLYTRMGKIELYPNFTSADSFTAGGVFQYIAITRDAATKNMYIHCNGKSAGTYNDASSMYVYDSNKRLIFFQDDKGTSGEHSGGMVAMIHISNYAMDSNSIKTKFTQLGSVLGIENMVSANDAFIYPNPVKDNIHISAPFTCNYRLTDISGRMHDSGVLRQGNNIINAQQLTAGMYFLTLEARTGKSTYKITKE